MSNAQVLIVEDEIIVAKDIQDRLKSLGYIVPDIASSGEEAIKKAAELRPDLVLMDIVLKGNIDGVEAAEQMRARFNIPVVYITAYADDSTLQRTKLTEPYGYILKPFEERELRITIEMALYKHRMESKLKENEQWFAKILNSISDGVIATNLKGLITFMNPLAERLTGWKQEEALYKDLREIFNIIDEQTGSISENPETRARREGATTDLADRTILIARDGAEIAIDSGAAPIKDDNGNIIGAVLVFREIAEPKRLEEQLQQSQKIDAPSGSIRPGTAGSESLQVSGTVLLVEDEVELRKLICGLLEEWGYTVLEAGSGLEALKISDQYKAPIDLMITDTIMPQMNGRELAERLVLLRPNLRVLYMSGYMDKTIGPLGKRTYLLEKPFSVDDLIGKIREALKEN